jgi:hypothetical protein
MKARELKKLLLFVLRPQNEGRNKQQKVNNFCFQTHLDPFSCGAEKNRPSGLNFINVLRSAFAPVGLCQ